MRVFWIKLYILVLLKIDVADELSRLDQWNFYTKNVNHITTIEKWLEITDWLHLEIESFYFSDFEIEHGVIHPRAQPSQYTLKGKGLSITYAKGP